MILKFTFLALLALVALNSCDATLSSIDEIAVTVREIVSTISRVVSIYKRNHPSITPRYNTRLPLSSPTSSDDATKPPALNPEVEKVARRMINKAKRVSNTLPNDHEGTTENLDNLLEITMYRLNINTNESLLDNALRRVHDHSTIIDRYYSDFIKFSQPKLRMAPSTIRDLIESIFSSENNKLRLSVISLSGYFETRPGSFIYEALANAVRAQKAIPFVDDCDAELSLQEQVKTIYDLVIVNELRALMMIVFSYKYQELVEGSVVNNSIKGYASDTLKRISDYLLAVRRITEVTSREKFRCDPPKHDLDLTCFRMEYLFGLFYLNERQISTQCSNPEMRTTTITLTPLRIAESNPLINLNQQPGYNQAPNYPQSSNYPQGSSSARKYSNLNLQYHSNPPYRGRYKRETSLPTVIKNEPACLSVRDKNLLMEDYCPKTKCHGILHDCKVAPKTTFCEATGGYGRRYQFINDEKHTISSVDCTGRYIDTMLEAPCRSLLCQCSEQGADSTATRTVSLLPQVSDVQGNMVVTNVRFQKKDNVVHLQIEQGKLLPEGKIKNGTTSWVPLPDLVYLQNVPDGSFWIKQGTERFPLIPDRDYTFLKYNKKTLNLDDVIAPMQFVITGVRLNFKTLTSQDPNSPLELHVQVTPYDYSHGILKPGSKWICVQTAAEHARTYSQYRKQVNLENADDPLKSGSNHMMTPPNAYVEFQVTDYGKDFGQLTIPYFDTRAAGVASVKALSGIGIAHRGSEGFGGFVAPKLITVDHSKFIQYEMDDEAVDSYTNF